LKKGYGQIFHPLDSKSYISAAHEDSSVVGTACHELEKKIGRKVVTSENYLALKPGAKKAKRVKA
jgi:hypothetical protein